MFKAVRDSWFLWLAPRPVWQIARVSPDLRGARGANKLFWKLNNISMLMLLLINQASNWPRIIRDRLEAPDWISSHNTSLLLDSGVCLLKFLMWQLRKWELGHKLKFVANICVKGVKINYCDLCVLFCLISPRHKTGTNCADWLTVSLVGKLLWDWVQMFKCSHSAV